MCVCVCVCVCVYEKEKVVCVGGTPNKTAAALSTIKRGGALKLSLTANAWPYSCLEISVTCSKGKVIVKNSVTCGEGFTPRLSNPATLVLCPCLLS